MLLLGNMKVRYQKLTNSVIAQNITLEFLNKWE